MDYPNPVTGVPTFLHTWSRTFNGTMLRALSIAAPTTFTWATANAAVYAPFYLPWPYFAARAFWQNGATVTSNVDIGIYSPQGAQIWHSGSTAQSGASAAQYVTCGVLLPPGPYLMGWTLSVSAASHIQGQLIAANAGRLYGLRQQSTALPLPAIATFAAYAGVGYPLMGITTTTTGF